MKKIIVTLIILLTVKSVFGQISVTSKIIRNTECSVEPISNNYKDSIVNTPFGPTLKSNVHYIDSKHYLNIKDQTIQVVDKNKGNVIKQFYESRNAGKNAFVGKSIRRSRTQGSFLQSKAGNRLITYAECSILGLNPPTITRFSSSWNVPSPPIKPSNQILYLFIGLSTIENGVGHLVQPVLQWGLSPAGGGKYWAICNWYVSTNSQYFYDSLIQVNSGTKLEGVIELASIYNNKFNYRSYFSGYGSGLNINNIPRLYDPSVAWEVYNVNGCDEYPLDERIRMSKINILFSGIIPASEWYNYKAQNNCDQYVNVVNPSLENGEIDIHLHTPTATDNFDDFHVYPNPFIDFLHISPARQINNCKIEVYNSLGILIHTEFHPKPDYEFNLNFQEFPAGLYFIKFYYNISKTHIFRVIKK